MHLMLMLKIFKSNKIRYIINVHNNLFNIQCLNLELFLLTFLHKSVHKLSRTVINYLLLKYFEIICIVLK